MKRVRTVLIFVISLYGFYAQSADVNKYPLFQSEEPLNLFLETDLVAIMEDKSEEPEYIQGMIIQHLENYRIRAFEIKVRPRGNTRRITDLCDFPPLKLNFKKNQLENSVFEGQDKLKFVSQCQQEKQFRNYVLEEYLLYKTYNIISEESYKVRLVNLTLRDTKLRLDPITMTGFLIEDDKTLSKRINAKRFEKPVYSQDSCAAQATDRFALFQYMIGNTDWYINTKHNTDVFRSKKDDSLIPVPFDFDFSGVINTIYAIPSKEIPITDVRQRYFKGSCRDIQEYDETIELFNQKKEEIYSLYNSFDLLPKSVIKKSLKYYKKFFNIINNPEQMNEFIVNSCYPNVVNFRVRR